MATHLVAPNAQAHHNTDKELLHVGPAEALIEVKGLWKWNQDDRAKQALVQRAKPTQTSFYFSLLQVVYRPCRIDTP